MDLGAGANLDMMRSLGRKTERDLIDIMKRNISTFALDGELPIDAVTIVACLAAIKCSTRFITTMQDTLAATDERAINLFIKTAREMIDGAAEEMKALAQKVSDEKVP